MANIQAKRVYETIITMMENDGLKYERDDEKLNIEIGFNTDDLAVKLNFIVDEERELVRVFSLLPFNFPEDKRVEGAVAACIANYGMVNGSFDYDFSDGQTIFRLVNSYKDGCFSEDIARYMLGVSLGTVDKYNDPLFLLSKGEIDITEFLEKENA